MPDDQTLFPVLETERLLLRSLENSDAEFIFKHFSDPAVTQHLLDSPPMSRRSEARDLITFYKSRERHDPNRWGVVTRSDNSVIGTCGFHNWAPRHHRAEIGYDLSPHAWGHGYMAEALRAVLAHGFKDMNLNRIEAFVFGENEKSIRLLDKLGFQGEGVLRDYFCFDGTFYDHQLFSRLETDV